MNESIKESRKRPYYLYDYSCTNSVLVVCFLPSKWRRQLRGGCRWRALYRGWMGTCVPGVGPQVGGGTQYFFFLLKTMMTSRIGRLVIKVVLGCNIGLRNFECQNLLYSETEGLIRSVMLGETGLFQAERHYYKSEFCRWPKRGFLVWQDSPHTLNDLRKSLFLYVGGAPARENRIFACVVLMWSTRKTKNPEKLEITKKEDHPPASVPTCRRARPATNAGPAGVGMVAAAGSWRGWLPFLAAFHASRRLLLAARRPLPRGWRAASRPLPPRSSRPGPDSPQPAAPARCRCSPSASPSSSSSPPAITQPPWPPQSK